MNSSLTHNEKQLILYSKGRFQEMNMITDLRKIVAEAYWIPVDSTTIGHVFGYVTRLFFKLKEIRCITESLEDFMFDVFKRKQEISPEDVIEMMISKMANMKSVHLELGEADEKYLPTKKGVDTHV